MINLTPQEKINKKNWHFLGCWPQEIFSASFWMEWWNKDFIEMSKKDYPGKNVAIMAHRAPQLALEVVLNGKTWEQAIAQDWRKRKAWQPGWKYIIE